MVYFYVLFTCMCLYICICHDETLINYYNPRQFVYVYWCINRLYGNVFVMPFSNSARTSQCKGEIQLYVIACAGNIHKSVRIRTKEIFEVENRREHAFNLNDVTVRALR
jgi:hypothetical protein